MLIIQVALIIAVFMYAFWVTKTLAVKVWNNAYNGRTTTSAEAYEVAMQPFWFVGDVCISYPLHRLLTALEARKAKR